MFNNLKVLEIGHDISTLYCGRIMSIMGAKVIKVEFPRYEMPSDVSLNSRNERDDRQKELLSAMNSGKKAVRIDLSSDIGKRDALSLISNSDIIINNIVKGKEQHDIFLYPKVKETNENLIYLLFSDFGTWGRRSDWKGTDLTLFHMSGNAPGLIGPVSEPQKEPPVRAGGYQVEFLSGLTGSTALMMAIFRRNMTGKGGYLEISKYEALVNQTIAGLANMAFGGSAPVRDLKKVKEASVGGMVGAIGGVLPAKDGYVAISPREDDQWGRWVQLMGKPEWSQKEKFSSRSGREEHHEELWNLIALWTKKFSKHEIAHWGQGNHIPCFPVNTVEDLLADEQFNHRDFFVDLKLTDGEPLKIPGVPYKFSRMPMNLTGSPAPEPGQHNLELLGHN